MQEICTLGLMRRGLETSLRFGSYGTPTGNVGATDRLNLRSLAPVLDPTTRRRPDATWEAQRGSRSGSTGNSRETGRAVWGDGADRSTEEAG